jgi:hypothetical protein
MSRKLGNPVNAPSAGASGVLIVKQAATGTAGTLTFDTLWVLPSSITLNTAASSYTRLTWDYVDNKFIINKVP